MDEPRFLEFQPFFVCEVVEFVFHNMFVSLLRFMHYALLIVKHNAYSVIRKFMGSVSLSVLYSLHHTQ